MPNPAILQHTQQDFASGLSNTLQYTSNTTAGSALVCFVECNVVGGIAVKVSDDKNGTWTRVVSDFEQEHQSGGFGGGVEMWVFFGTVGGVKPTVTVQVSVANIDFWILEVSNVNSVGPISTFGNSNSLAMTGGQVNNTQIPCITFGAFGAGGTATTAFNGYNLLDSPSANGNALVYQIFTNAGGLTVPGCNETSVNTWDSCTLSLYNTPVIKIVQTCTCGFWNQVTTTSGTGNLSNASSPFINIQAANSASIYVQGAGTAGADYQGTMLTYTDGFRIVCTPHFGTSLASTNWMSIGDAYGSAGSGGSPTTWSIQFTNNTTAGNLLFVAMLVNTNGGGNVVTVSSVSDTGGNQWTSCGSQFHNNDYNFAAYYAVAKGGATTFTFTLSGGPTPGTGNPVQLLALEASALAGYTWKLDAYVATNGTSDASGNCTSSGVSTNYPNELMVMVPGLDNWINSGSNGWSTWPNWLEANNNAGGFQIGAPSATVYGDSQIGTYILTSSISSQTYTVQVNNDATSIFLLPIITFAASPPSGQSPQCWITISNTPR